MKDELHIFCKGIWAGIVGCKSADGASCLKTCIWKRDKESAMVLWIPGTCFAEAVKLNFAAHRNKYRNKSITSSEWDVPDVKEWTIASLSQRNRIRFLDQSWPHVTATSTIGYSSFHCMFLGISPALHFPLNQWPWK